ncbi:MAG: GNAT family N-acetyltransferase [Pseudomonadota bacterium]
MMAESPDAAFVLREANRNDLPAVQALLARTWHATYDAHYGADEVDAITARWHAVPALEAQMAQPGTLMLVAQDGAGKIVGELYISQPPQHAPSDDAMLHRLYVDPDAQGTGVGTALLRAGLKAVPATAALTLEVEPANKSAIAFYERHGFAAATTVASCGSANDGGGVDHAALVMRRPAATR